MMMTSSGKFDKVAFMHNWAQFNFIHYRLWESVLSKGGFCNFQFVFYAIFHEEYETAVTFNIQTCFWHLSCSSGSRINRPKSFRQQQEILVDVINVTVGRYRTTLLRRIKTEKRHHDMNIMPTTYASLLDTLNFTDKIHRGWIKTKESEFDMNSASFRC